MTLADYIRMIGDPAAAKLFGEEVRTIQSWRRLERRPRTEKAPEIIRVTGGKVTWSGIYATSKGKAA